jgi:hypothetical protein
MAENTLELKLELGLDEDERLPEFAWPGGYPLAYRCGDGGTLCPACANGGNGSEAATPDAMACACPDDRQWTLVGCEPNWEDDGLACDHCSAPIPCAYPPEPEPLIPKEEQAAG